jgi:hypothetical protein
MDIQEKLNAFEQALKSMNFREDFENMLRNAVLPIAERTGDLLPLNVYRATSHISLLSPYQAEDLSKRFEEILETGTYLNPIERFWKNKNK